MGEITSKLDEIQRRIVGDASGFSHDEGLNISNHEMQALIKEDRKLCEELDAMMETEEIFLAQRAKQK